jgi:GntR family transcriptional regulator, transcriptional repressor for pyruvate dehydrogenase complex
VYVPTKKSDRRIGPRSRVNERIIRALRRQIHEGELKPGDRLPPERQLASLLGVSRGSVREALRALELSGVVRSQHGEGNFVAAVPGDGATAQLAQFVERQRANLHDLFDARKTLEPQLAAVAAERASRDEVKRLRTAIEEQERDWRTGDLEGAFRADRLFHQVIAEATRNQTLINLYGFLSDLVADGRREAIESDARRAQSALDHRRIYQAFVRRDAAAASAAMRQHVENVERIVMGALQGYERAAAMIPVSLLGPEPVDRGEGARRKPASRAGGR